MLIHRRGRVTVEVGDDSAVGTQVLRVDGRRGGRSGRIRRLLLVLCLCHCSCDGSGSCSGDGRAATQVTRNVFQAGRAIFLQCKDNIKVYRYGTTLNSIVEVTTHTRMFKTQVSTIFTMFGLWRPSTCNFDDRN